MHERGWEREKDPKRRDGKRREKKKEVTCSPSTPSRATVSGAGDGRGDDGVKVPRAALADDGARDGAERLAAVPRARSSRGGRRERAHAVGVHAVKVHVHAVAAERGRVRLDAAAPDAQRRADVDARQVHRVRKLDPAVARARDPHALHAPQRRRRNK